MLRRSDNLATMGSGSESGGVDVGHNPGGTQYRTLIFVPAQQYIF